MVTVSKSDFLCAKKKQKEDIRGENAGENIARKSRHTKGRVRQNVSKKCGKLTFLWFHGHLATEKIEYFLWINCEFVD